MDKQQIKARFFGAHIGCRVNVFGMAEYTNGGVTCDENGIFKLFDGYDYHPFDDKCKLILRPLSFITDEEVVEAFAKSTNLFIVGIARDDCKIVGVGAGGGNVAIWTKVSQLPVGRFMETWSSVLGRQEPELVDYMAVDYLRSINICLPFCGLDPIAEGWAILDEEFSENAPQETPQEEKI